MLLDVLKIFYTISVKLFGFDASLKKEKVVGGHFI